MDNHFLVTNIYQHPNTVVAIAESDYEAHNVRSHLRRNLPKHYNLEVTTARQIVDANYLHAEIRMRLVERSQAAEAKHDKLVRWIITLCFVIFWLLFAILLLLIEVNT